MGKFTHEELKSLIYGALPAKGGKPRYGNIYTASFAMELDISYRDCERAVRCLERAGLVGKAKR